MQLECLPDALGVALRAADLLEESLAQNPAATVLLPAGATPVPLYAEVVRRVRAGRLDLARTRLFQLDEILGVGPGDGRSFHTFLTRHLVEPLGLEACFHGLDGEASDPEAEIERHRAELERVGPADLALLGLGKNGHVAFNEPGSTIADKARVVVLHDNTLAALRGAFPNDCPRRGMTLGLAEIAASHRIALLVTGASKAEILARFLSGERTSERPVTQLVRHPRFAVLADESAARTAAQSGP